MCQFTKATKAFCFAITGIFLFQTPIQAETIPYKIIQDTNPLKIHTPSLANQKTTKLQLKNGINVYIISDPAAIKSAAALSVGSGSWDDPSEYAGMAHFCEHMLFMGSSKYPDENGFFKAVLDGGGTANAYTAPDRTVYMFSSNHEPFDATLDIFAQFFISPLFKKESVNRELLAVNQEHAKNVENDDWREWFIFKETGNQAHPNAKFSTGTKETLSVIPLETLKSWYRTHYSPSRMYLAIYTNQPPEKIANSVAAIFSEIPSSDPPSLEFGHLLSDEQLGHITYIEPIQDRKQISFIWEMPKEITLDRRAKAASIISYTLNYKGSTSLFQLLKDEGLAENLRADTDQLGTNCALLALSIHLTKKGVAQLDTVIAYTFGFINQLRENQIPSHIYTEYKTMTELDYTWQSRQDEFSFASHAAHAMVDEPLTTFPYYTATIASPKPSSVKVVLNQMTPRNTAICVSASSDLTKQTYDRQEKWMKTSYLVSTIDEGKLDEWTNIGPHAQLSLPSPNPYIPTNLALIHTTQGMEQFEPKLLDNGSKGTCYFLSDNYYLIPETTIQIGIKSPKINRDITSIALTDLYLLHLYKSLSSLLNSANRAGLEIAFFQNNLKLHIDISGYNQKTSLLLSDIISHMNSSIPSQDDFELYKENLLSKYENSSYQIPYFQACELMRSLFSTNNPTGEDLKKALVNIEYNDFFTYTNQLFNTVYIEGMIVGNLNEEQATKMWKGVLNNIGATSYPKSEHPQLSHLKLNANQGPYTINTSSEMQGNAALLMVQIDEPSFNNIATQKVLSQALHEAFFDTLRTKQQTAYIAKSWPAEENDVLAFFLGVHSSSHYPEELLARFELFLEDFERNLETNIPKERFLTLKESMMTTLSKPPRNLDAKATELNFLAFEKNGLFTRRQELINAIQLLSYEQFLANTKKYFSRENTKRLAVLLKGNTCDEKPFSYQAVTVEELKANATETTLTSSVAEL